MVQIRGIFMGKPTEISHVLWMKNVWKKQQKIHEKNNKKCVKKATENA